MFQTEVKKVQIICEKNELSMTNSIKSKKLEMINQ